MIACGGTANRWGVRDVLWIVYSWRRLSQKTIYPLGNSGRRLYCKYWLERGRFVQRARLVQCSPRCWCAGADWSSWKLMWLGRERRGRTSDRIELSGGNSSIALDWSFPVKEIENCNPVEGEKATSGIVIVGLLLDCKSEAGLLSGEDGLEGIFEGEELGERKVTTRLEGKSEPEGVKDGNLSCGSVKTERQLSQWEKMSVVRTRKRNKTNLNRWKWSHGLVKLSRTHDWINMFFLFLIILSHIM